MSWTPYENFPDLSGANLICFDTETKEIEMIPLHSDIHIVPDRAKE